MYARLSLAVLSVVLLKVLQTYGGFSEILSFKPSKNHALVSGIVFNILVIIMFAELYWNLDKNLDPEPEESEQQHFGFENPIDAYYFSIVTSSSVGYGDYLPKTKKAKILNIVHILTMFFVIIPIVLEAFKTEI